MLVVHSPAELKQHIARLRKEQGQVVFVPTMGNLHAGHMKLVDVAKQLASVVVVSIYVNPLQFGVGEDYADYPRTLEVDCEALNKTGIQLLFVPGETEIYPRGQAAQTIVEVPGLSDVLCGASRPGHFRGVTTVVARLLHLVMPDMAVFGKKDYQQLLLIRLLTADLGLPIEIVGVDTVREPDGLALSSRNQYLTTEERRIAPQLYTILCDLRQRILDHGFINAKMESQVLDSLSQQGFHPEYLSVRRQQDLAPPASDDKELVILTAVWLGHTRLIDNLEVVLSK